MFRVFGRRAHAGVALLGSRQGHVALATAVAGCAVALPGSLGMAVADSNTVHPSRRNALTISSRTNQSSSTTRAVRLSTGIFTVASTNPAR